MGCRLASATLMAIVPVNLLTAARKPVEAYSVAVFRIAFGLVAMLGSLRFLLRGWVDELYLNPEHHLTYVGFNWVKPLPAPWMHLHVFLLAVLGGCIMVGYRHRIAAALFTAGFVYTELIEAALYLNHYWFMTLTGLLLVLLPVHHHWSLDAYAGRVSASTSVSTAVIWIFRAQVGIVYLFSGLAKLNADWLLEAQPMKLWLSDRTHLPLVGHLLDEALIAYLASWFGAFFDCTIVAWLSWCKSRLWAYLVVVGFHLATAALFQIGVFPWLMIAGALIFFHSDWPSRFTTFISHLKTTVCKKIAATNISRAFTGHRKRKVKPQAITQSTILQTPTAALPTFSSAAGVQTTTPEISRPIWFVLLLLAVLQMVLPLRHYIYGGNVRWTEEGYYLAWRVMLTEKSGHLEFSITDPSTSTTWSAGPELVLTNWQIEHADVRPDLIHATALLIADHYRQAGIAQVEVRADAWVSMNGKSARRIIDPSIDLASQSRSVLPAHWILKTYK